MLHWSQLQTVVLGILLGCLTATPTSAAEALSPSPTDPTGPAITIVAPRDGALVRERALVLSLQIRTPNTDDEHLQVLVDGRPSPMTRDIAVIDAAPSPQALPAVTHRITVLIPPQDCIVTVRAGESDPQPAVLRLRWQGELAKAPKPKLYLLAVGVSDYEVAALKLRYPAKDARDLATVLTAQAGKLYGAVESRILTDRDATRANILDGLQWLERQTTARDVAVLFLGGHGLNDPSTAEYYYLPYDSEPAAIKRTMIPGGTFQTSLRSIAGRVVLFLDTCHSGNVLGAGWQLRGGLDVQSLADELASGETGVVVFTASTRRQSAREAASWDNGAFTKAVVEGLRGQGLVTRKEATAIPITITMLDAYISERVKELTQGTQTPTTAKPSTLADFALAIADGTPIPTRQEPDVAVRSKRRRGLDVVSVGAHYMTPLGPDLARSGRVWTHVALALKMAGRNASAFSFRLAGGPVGGQLAQSFLAPDGTAVENPSLPLAGALFELGLSLRVRRQRVVRPSVDVGFQLGGAGYGSPQGTSSVLLLAFPLRGRLSFVSGQNAVAVELGIAADLAPTARYRYTGAGGAFLPESRAWGLVGTLGVVYEYKTKGVE